LFRLTPKLQIYNRQPVVVSSCKSRVGWQWEGNKAQVSGNNAVYSGIVSAAGLYQDTHRFPGHVSKGRHVEDIVVWEEEEVVGIVEPINVVQLVLEQVPPLVKLIDC